MRCAHEDCLPSALQSRGAEANVEPQTLTRLTTTPIVRSRIIYYNAPLYGVYNEVSIMDDKQTRWVARLTSIPSSSIDALLHMPLGLDVWERHADALVVAASEAQLLELERRRLAKVERLSTVAEFQACAQCRASPSERRSQE